MKYFTYILRSKKLQKHYYGSTNNLPFRLHQHNSGSSKFTKTGIPWELVYSEEFPSRTEAIKREKFFKSTGGYKWLKEHGII